MNENINKEIETIKKNQIEVLELNNAITELKNSLDGFTGRLDQAEEKISELEYRSSEIIKSEEPKEKNEDHESPRDLKDTNQQTNICIIGASEIEERGRELT